MRGGWSAACAGCGAVKAELPVPCSHPRECRLPPERMLARPRADPSPERTPAPPRPSQVASDYRRARALLADQAPGGGGGGRGQGAAAAPGGQGGMWAKLMGEIDRVGLGGRGGLRGGSAGRMGCRAAGGDGSDATRPGAVCSGGHCRLQRAGAQLLPALPRNLLRAQVAGSAAHSLDTVVRSVASGPGEALDAIRHLLALRAVGVPAAQGMDPVRWAPLAALLLPAAACCLVGCTRCADRCLQLQGRTLALPSCTHEQLFPPAPLPCSAYVEAQERHVRAMLEGRQAQHAARLEALRRQQRESAEYEVRRCGAGPAAAASMWAAWA